LAAVELKQASMHQCHWQAETMSQ